MHVKILPLAYSHHVLQKDVLICCISLHLLGASFFSGIDLGKEKNSLAQKLKVVFYQESVFIYMGNQSNTGVNISVCLVKFS